MLSFFDVIIYFMLSLDVIISYSLQMLPFFCFHFSLYRMGVSYHLCYHLMLSFFVLISPLFSFSWKRDHSLSDLSVSRFQEKEKRREMITKNYNIKW